ncbi:hypothetical protein EMPG_16177 [Blastomyces silverae]|uniref:Uncharacterized protein n=1 Tax=Blastomyces silverae TaxID=2060906 RepID=A0A0H1BBM3_9EURO|nr:hypothetical protein EMPG_16177 [Blastomyces silverae]
MNQVRGKLNEDVLDDKTVMHVPAPPFPTFQKNLLVKHWIFHGKQQEKQREATMIKTAHVSG